MAARLEIDAEEERLRSAPRSDGYKRIVQESDVVVQYQPVADERGGPAAWRRALRCRAGGRGLRRLLGAGLCAAAAVAAAARLRQERRGPTSPWERPAAGRGDAVGLSAQPASFRAVAKGLCEDFGWGAILEKEACQRAAWEMDLPVIDAVGMNVSQWPNGCNYFKSARDRGYDALFLNSNPQYKGNGKSITDLAKDGVREVICSMDKETEEVQHAALGGQDDAPQASSDPAPEEDPSCSYVIGDEGGNSCPAGSAPLTEPQCRELPFHFGGVLSVPLTVDSPDEPRGCFFHYPHYHFNNNSKGSNHSERTPYCRRCDGGGAEPGDEHLFGDWSEWRENQRLKPSTRYRRAETSSCAHIKMHPIHTLDECNKASEELGFPAAEACEQALAERPEGCYYLRNYEDGTGTLWLNINPASEGNGAETSDLARGKLRQPLCSKERSGEARSRSTSVTLSDDVTEVALTDDLADLQDSDDNDKDVVQLPDGNAVAQTRFKKIVNGTCRERGFRPITTKVSCSMAAHALGLVETDPAISEAEVERPEGCYYLRNTEDLTSTLWLNNNAESEGKGGETSDWARGIFRQPICDTELSTVITSRNHEIISQGTCNRSGMLPILNKAACEEAVKDLGLASSGALEDNEPKESELPDSPEGCYFYLNAEDGTASLWLNTAKSSVGKGAASDGVSLRQPICARPVPKQAKKPKPSPTEKPTAEPTPEPTPEPEPEPTLQLTAAPTAAPKAAPTAAPTAAPRPKESLDDDDIESLASSLAAAAKKASDAADSRASPDEVPLPNARVAING